MNSDLVYLDLDFVHGFRSLILRQRKKKQIPIIRHPLPKGQKFVTYFIDPWIRVVKQYKGRHWLNKEYVKYSFPEYIREVKETDNWMVRVLSGVGKAVPFGRINEKIYAMAKKRLETDCIFFGMENMWEKSQILVKKKFGWVGIWANNHYFQELEVHDNEYDNYKKKFVEQNKWDYKLMKRLNELFKKKNPKYKTICIRIFNLINKIRGPGRNFSKWCFNLKPNYIGYTISFIPHLISIVPILIFFKDFYSIVFFGVFFPDFAENLWKKDTIINNRKGHYLLMGIMVLLIIIRSYGGFFASLFHLILDELGF